MGWEFGGSSGVVLGSGGGGGESARLYPTGRAGWASTAAPRTVEPDSTRSSARQGQNVCACACACGWMCGFAPMLRGEDAMRRRRALHLKVAATSGDGAGSAQSSTQRDGAGQ